MAYPTYTARPKRATKKDRISFDATDYSNAFKEFGVSSTKSSEEAGAFNPTGVVEKVPGPVDQSFTGQLYNIPDVISTFWDWHINDTVVECQWQIDGLDDPTGDVFYGNVTIQEMSPISTFGTVTAFAFTAIAADSDGIQLAAGT